jgi:hypothetical protein
MRPLKSESDSLTALLSEKPHAARRRNRTRKAAAASVTFSSLGVEYTVNQGPKGPQAAQVRAL